MRQVAERAAVAMSSVSRVLSNHPDVSPAMRERVLAAVEDLGYRPDLLAQSLRRRETMTVGFQVADIANPLFAEIVKAAETRLREEGYSVILTNSEGNSDLDADQIYLLEQRRVDGIIVSLAREDDERTLRALERIDTPFIVLDRDVPIPARRVVSDHRPGMREAVRHLLDLGHRRIALISGPPMRPVRERRLALEECFAELGLPPTYRVVEASFSVEAGERAAAELLDLAEPPTAIIAGGNQIMLGALRVFRARGVALGRDLSFVGCDDVAVAELYDPPVAVVSRDTHEIGVAAADLLLSVLRGDGGQTEIVLPTRFVPRPSCGPVSPPG
jgi:LacI family transcriptional regulator